MDGHAIASGALGYAGLGMLTSDIGGTRFAESLRARGESRTAAAGREGAARADRSNPAPATRP